jgi:DNA-binding transcriptional ArsR family regulator
VDQGERTVEALAGATGMGVTNTSAHLQVLRHARLVETRKDGTRVYYRLVGEEVAGFVASLRDLARARLAEVDRVVQDYFVARDALEPVSRAELVARAGVLAPQAVERLRAKRFKARRLVDGMPEWRLAGLPVAVGEE